MDIYWERSCPYFNLDKSQIKEIFTIFQHNEIDEVKLIEIGCRNSNFILKTKTGKYLLRVTSQDSALVANELALNQELASIIKVPKMLDYSQNNKRYFILYEFIQGSNFSHFLCTEKIKEEHIIQVGQSLAKIHSFQPIFKVQEFELPPFSTWFNLFLSNKKTQNLVGEKRIKMIHNFLMNNHNLLDDIERLKSFVHSDFRPANMILASNDEIYIVDWEYCTNGHSLADIGQFFRYKECFSKHDKILFAQAYNSYAETKLPDNWYLLGRIRDLINPLQSLGNVGKKLQQERDLLKVIDDILRDIL